MHVDEIIASAVQRINAIPEAHALVLKRSNQEVDAILDWKWGQTERRFYVEVKYELRHAHIPKLKHQARDHSPFLLIAYRLFPGIKEQLRNACINYVEANGNMFISEPALFIDIDRFETLSEEKRQSNRAFTKAGIKVVFQLLLNEDLLNASQRRIAMESGVALGNIPHILKGLLTLGYAVRKTQGIAWTNKAELIGAWVQAYNTTLRPALVKGRYSYLEDRSWQDVELEKGQTCWGGEAAADHYTHYLRAQELTLYTTHERSQLMSKYRIKPDGAGRLFVLEKFWPQAMKDAFAPPLLVYADLLNAPNKRNLETAERLWNEIVKDV